MKKIIKSIFVTFAFVFFAFISVTFASAVDLTITCVDEGPCDTSPAGNAALFYETNWLPGDTATQNIEIINNDLNDDCNLYLDTRNEKDDKSLASAIFTVIKLGDSDLYGVRNGDYHALSDKTLRNLFDAGDIYLTTIPSQDKRTVNWTVTFDYRADNEFQNTETVFDFDLHFSCGEPPGPSPSPSPAASPSPGSASSPSSGAGGTTGASPSPTAFTAAGGGILPFFGVFAPGAVAGAAAEEEEEVVEKGELGRQEGEVAGAAVCCSKICPWWWILLILQTVLLSLHFLKKFQRKKEPKKAIAWPLMLTIAAILGHFVLHKVFVGTLGYEASLYCRWFWLAAIGDTVLLSTVFPRLLRL